MMFFPLEEPQMVSIPCTFCGLPVDALDEDLICDYVYHRICAKAVKRRLIKAIFDTPPETPEEVDAFLRSEGYDPDEVRKRVRAYVEETLTRLLKEETKNET